MSRCPQRPQLPQHPPCSQRPRCPQCPDVPDVPAPSAVPSSQHPSHACAGRGRVLPPLWHPLGPARPPLGTQGHGGHPGPHGGGCASVRGGHGARPLPRKADGGGARLSKGSSRGTGTPGDTRGHLGTRGTWEDLGTCRDMSGHGDVSGHGHGKVGTCRDVKGHGGQRGTDGDMDGDTEMGTCRDIRGQGHGDMLGHEGQRDMGQWRSTGTW